MKIAFEFGADAVYLGLPDFSLRVRVNKFREDQLREVARYCQENNKRFYLTLNIYAHNEHIDRLDKHLKLINELKPNALIVSDPGILMRIKKNISSEVEIHLSTQANATNFEAVRFWFEQGVKRVILARELSIKEIFRIKKEVPEVELEAFFHGAMCMSYSGRCFLSKWMTDRSGNLGDCAQPCRWSFKKCKQAEDLPIFRMIDDKNRFEIELEQDRHGSYFFNSYDICMIEKLKELCQSGVASFKIEGRAKSVYYLATVTRAYRQVLDAISSYQDKKISKKELAEEVDFQKKEIDKLAHRGYWTGFFLGDQPPHLIDQPSIQADWEFVGISIEESSQKKSKTREVFIHNSLKKNEKVEIICRKNNISAKILKIIDNESKIEKISAHGGQNKSFNIEFNIEIFGRFLIRKNKNGI